MGEDIEDTEMPTDDTRILLSVVRGMCAELLSHQLEFGVKRIALCRL